MSNFFDYIDYNNADIERFDINYPSLFGIAKDNIDDLERILFTVQEGEILRLNFSKVYKGDEEYFSIFYNKSLNIMCSLEIYNNEFFITIVSPFLKNTITVNNLQSFKEVINQISSEPVRALMVEDLPLISKNMKNIVRRSVLQERHLVVKSQNFTKAEIDFIYSKFCGMNDYYYNDDVENVSFMNSVTWDTFCLEKALKEQVFKKLPDKAEELLRYRNYNTTESKVYSNFLKSSYR